MNTYKRICNQTRVHYSTHFQVRLSLEEPYKTVVANFFNRLTQETEVSANYWNKELKVRQVVFYCASLCNQVARCCVCLMVHIV